MRRHTTDARTVKNEQPVRPFPRSTKSALLKFTEDSFYFRLFDDAPPMAGQNSDFLLVRHCVNVWQYIGVPSPASKKEGSWCRSDGFSNGAVSFQLFTLFALV